MRYRPLKLLLLHRATAHWQCGQPQPSCAL